MSALPSPPPGISRSFCVAVFLSSLASLGFEVVLLRVFSVTLWHHFAWMVVSIAMLGLAASGTALATAWAVSGRRPRPRPALFLLLGGLITVSYLVSVRIPMDPARLSWDKSQLLLLPAFYLVLAAPFFVNGLILSSAFVSAGAMTGALYGADLTGAAAGAVLSLPLQAVFRPGQLVLLLSAAVLAAAALATGGRLRVVSSFLTALSVAGAFLFPGVMEAEISPYKELPGLLRMSGAREVGRLDSPYGRVDLFESPGVRSAPGLSLRFRGEIPRQLGLALDGSSVTTVSLPGPAGTKGFLDELPAALAFDLRGSGRVLLVDSRGGLSPQMARRHGASSVTCIEGNPAVAALLESSGVPAFSPCDGGAVFGTARAWLGSGSRRFDLIDLTLGGTIPSAGPMAGGEDYGLTVEAFGEYLAALGEDGILNVSLFISPPYRAELRVFTTVLAALERAGAVDPPAHVAALRSLGVLCLLVKRSAITEGETGRIRAFARARWFDPVHFRGMRADEAGVHIRTVGDDLAASFAAIADRERRASFVAGYPFDLSPTTDDRPYFHDFLRVSTLGEVFRLVGGKWEFFISEGALQPFILFQASVLGLILVLFPAAAAGRGAAPGRLRALLYFSFIGAGYMLVEIFFIQKMILPMEHPVHAVPTVLGALLLSSGAGSWTSRSWGAGRLWKISLLLASLLLLSLPAVDVLSASLPAMGAATRKAAVFAFLFAPGFLMGTLFPGGVRWLVRDREKVIPWAWAVNGFFSVTVPVAAVVTAAAAGYRLMILLGALCYLGASFAGAGFCASPTMGTKRTPPI